MKPKPPTLATSPYPPAPLSVWWYARSDTHVTDSRGHHWNIEGLTFDGSDWRRERGKLHTRADMDAALRSYEGNPIGKGARLVRVETYEDGSERES